MNEEQISRIFRLVSFTPNDKFEIRRLAKWIARIESGQIQFTSPAQKVFYQCHKSASSCLPPDYLGTLPDNLFHLWRRFLTALEELKRAEEDRKRRISEVIELGINAVIEYPDVPRSTNLANNPKDDDYVDWEIIWKTNPRFRIDPCATRGVQRCRGANKL